MTTKRSLNELDEALRGSRTAIEEILKSAEAEMEALESRRRELQTTIQGARLILEGGSAGSERLTLHEAIERVLRESYHEWMTVREIADEINERALYTKRDGSLVETNQIHARVKSYDSRFRKNPENRSEVGLA